MSQSIGNSMDITFKASEDLSSYQYHFMKLDADGKVAHCTASTDVVIGILQNYPDAEDKAALVRINGTSKLVMSGTNDEGAYITPSDQEASYAEGLASTTNVDFIGAIALEAATAADDIIEVLITHLIYTAVAS